MKLVRRIPFVIALLAGLAVVPHADAATRYWINSTVDASVRNCAPSSTGCGYVIGHLRNGEAFDATYQPSGNPDSWSYGYGYGSFGHCGWVQNGNLGGTAEQPQSPCSSAGTNFSYTEFMTEINALPGSGVSDGSNAHIDYGHTNCDPAEAGRAYGNADPFATGATAGSLYYGTLSNGNYVKFRYTTKNGLWAMVRDPFPDFGAPADTWFFVRRNCLTPEAAPIPVG